MSARDSSRNPSFTHGFAAQQSPKIQRKPNLTADENERTFHETHKEVAIERGFVVRRRVRFSVLEISRERHEE